MNQRIPEKNITGAFQRNELNGSLLIVPKGCSHNEAIIINRTGKEILEQINGERTISDIVNIIARQNGEVPLVQIQNDVDKFINYLFKMNLLSYKGDDKVYTGKQVARIGDLTIHRCGEGSIKRLLNLFKEETYFDFLNSVLTKDSYDPLSLRAKLFNYLEEFYILERAGKDIALFSMLNGRHQPNHTASFNRLLAVEQISQETIVKFMQECFINYLADIDPECHRVRLTKIIETIEISGEMGEILRQTGFKTTAILLNEYGPDKNQLILDHFLAS